MSHVHTSTHSLAVRHSAGQGPTIVLVHGNSCSSRCFERQLESPLARCRLIAIDLPGHGDSPRAAHPDTGYTLPGYADALVQAARELDATGAVFVGWSLGGHVLLEAANRLPDAAGFLVFGAPPLGSAADLARGFMPNPAIGAAFRAESTDEEILALVTAFFRPGYAVPASFPEDFRRTDPRARASLGASVTRNELRDEVRIVAELTRPLAILHGAHDAVVNRRYFDGLAMPTLWRGTVHEIPDAGHAPHWEAPESFNGLLEQFVRDCTERS